jgi:hypothetical protein
MAKFTTRGERVGLRHIARSDGEARSYTHHQRKGKLKYQLPTAEYDLRGDYDREKVLALAKKAAAETGKTAWVLVTEAKHRIWSGLPKVDEED